MDTKWDMKMMNKEEDKMGEIRAKLTENENEKLTLIKERDQALEDLRNVESAFSDVHRKYERAKTLIENFKKNEDILKRRDQEFHIKLENRDNKYETLKSEVQNTLEKMNVEYEVKLKESESDNQRLRALLRKTEMKVDTLENDLEQKARENAKLNLLCDDLINGRDLSKNH